MTFLSLYFPSLFIRLTSCGMHTHSPPHLWRCLGWAHPVLAYCLWWTLLCGHFNWAQAWTQWAAWGRKKYFQWHISSYGKQQHHRQQAQDSSHWSLPTNINIVTPLEIGVRNVVIASKENIGLIDNATASNKGSTEVISILWLLQMAVPFDLSFPSFVMTFWLAHKAQEVLNKDEVTTAHFPSLPFLQPVDCVSVCASQRTLWFPSHWASPSGTLAVSGCLCSSLSI